MNNSFTNEDKNAALDFAYAMGLKRPAAQEEPETDSAYSFACAMGLKRYLKHEKADYKSENKRVVTRLRFS